MANSKLIKPIAKFPFVDKKELQEHLRLSDRSLASWREKLPTPIYFIQPDRKFLYNLTLWKHYFLAGAGKEHDRLVEEYAATLPAPR